MNTSTLPNEAPVFLNEDEVKKHLTWPLIFLSVDRALRSICENTNSNNAHQPISFQPARTLIKHANMRGVLFSMPGYIGNYTLDDAGEEPKVLNTLACKLVTSFKDNLNRDPPLPSIMATICLFDTVTGRLSCILEGTEITAQRTAGASLVATKHLYFNRIDKSSRTGTNLAIVGCGVQGRIHAIGMLNTFEFESIVLWNRSTVKAVSLVAELEGMRSEFLNRNVAITVANTVGDCVLEADIIVTTTNASSPVLNYTNLKEGVHINAIGAGKNNHHSELDDDIYKNGKIYVDAMASAVSELKTLQHEITGEVGEVMQQLKPLPDSNSLTIFQSLGMAVEDGAVAQAIYEKYLQSL